ncbi:MULTISPECIES: ead/Ea22-like family protein [Enterobacter]|uniref:ead/Ea22-like family protein n=1 Tax=Enterobacter TaxID=547 RepID=UPI0006662FD8|nr:MULTISPECIES: ead/Ea22-like family protein [Enterobacter cloacae complex]MCM7648271.1 ead/Ea22-like family protein [Enterobacter asburiae]
MSNIDKRALRKKLNRRLNDAFGFQRTSGGKHTMISLSIDECKSVLVALDELEAKGQMIAELEAKLETADKLQDSSFRHGLQHGFSYGQTDDQAGFEQAIQAYGQQWKGE